MNNNINYYIASMGKTKVDQSDPAIWGALQTLKEAGLIKLTPVPCWSHGTKLIDYDGNECVYIGPSVDGMEAVVCYPDSGEYLTRVYEDLVDTAEQI